MLEENSILFFCKKHATKGLICLLLFVAVGFFIGKGMLLDRSCEKEDCIRAHQLFSEVQRGQILSKEALEEISEILKRQPFLTPKYEQFITLALLTQHQEEKALLQIASTIQSHKVHEDSINKFNEISLLIEKKEFDKALTATKELNLQLENDHSYPTLYACSLLRLVFLAHQQNDLLLTKVTWDKLNAHPSWFQLAPFFYENEFALKDYLEI